MGAPRTGGVRADPVDKGISVISQSSTSPPLPSASFTSEWFPAAYSRRDVRLPRPHTPDQHTLASDFGVLFGKVCREIWEAPEHS